MAEEIHLKTRDWERLLTPTQQEKYKSVIKQGYFSDYHGNEWRHNTFYGAFLWKYPKYVNVVKIFEKVVGHRPLWEDVTDDNLRDLFEELGNNYAPNSVRTMCACIKAIIRENDESREIPSPKFGKILRNKTVPVQAVALTDEEIDSIIDYNPRGRTQRYVKRMFLMECLCGARLSDCQKITPENIDETGHFLVYVAKKTKAEVRVPIHKKLRPYLVCGTADEPVGGLSERTFNASLQKLCKNCGISGRVKVFTAGKEKIGKKYTFVTSHTGRRSFATNLSKKGVPIEQIAIMMGHISRGKPNIGMTQNYIVGKTEIDSDTLKIFGVYDKTPGGTTE